jgi:hypothetical protein
MIRTAAGFLVAILLAGCSDEGRSTGPRSIASGGPSNSPAFVNGGDCPPSSDARLPNDAGCVSTVSAGEGQLSVYALLGSDGRPESWRLHLSSDGLEIDQELHAGTEFSYPRAVGGVDVDGDGDPEWWVKVMDYASHGAPWSGLHLFFQEGTDLVPLAYESEPLTINFGGISRLGEGALCRGGALVLLRAEALDRQNTRWRTSERLFSLDGPRADLVRRTQDVLEIEDYNDPDLDPYYRVTCEGKVFTTFGP